VPAISFEDEGVDALAKKGKRPSFSNRAKHEMTMNEQPLIVRQRSLSSARLWQRTLLLFCALPLFLAACNFSAAQSPEEAYQPVRPLYPTFTPTAVTQPLPGDAPAPAADLQVNDDAEAAPVDPAPTAIPDTPVVAEAPTEPPLPTTAPTVAPPRLVVDSPLVNVRAGPGTEFPVITTIERGQEFDIVGKNSAGDWWRFCCVNNEPAWVVDELVQTDGAVDGVPISDAVAQVPATTEPVAAPVAAPPAAQPEPEVPTEPAPTEPPPAPTFGFELQTAEQFPENKLVRVFLYVFDSEQALGGYSVRVTKDGTELPVSATSVAGQPSLSWPIADARQRFQNMKVEFPGVQAPGTWVVQLVDGGGNLVGPPVTFTLEGNDTDQELYVRYKKL